MSDQHGEERKHINIKNATFIDRLSDAAESRRKRSRAKDASDPYVPRTAPRYENTTIDYPDTSVLARPLDMPPAVRRGLGLFLVAAAVIGGIFLFRYFDATVSAPAREAAEVVENVTRRVPYDLPVLLDLMPLSDTDIMASLSASGDTLFERTPIGTNEAGGFQVVKLPEGVSLADAAAVYLTGLDKVNAVSASKLLNGSWNLTVTREAPYNILVRYADFSSGSIENAIQSALLSQNLDSEEETESGIDDSGNTYLAGSVEKSGETYQWRVSVIPLAEVYEIKGLPDDALYVGIRMTEAESA